MNDELLARASAVAEETRQLRDALRLAREETLGQMLLNRALRMEIDLTERHSASLRKRSRRQGRSAV